MFDAAPRGGEEGIVFDTVRKECSGSSPTEMGLRVAEKVWDSLVRIERHISKLPAQAERWRAAATELNVNGALSGDPKIQSAMFRIADRYVRMAHSAEIKYRLALAQNRLSETQAYQQFAAAADQASALAPASARTRSSSRANSAAWPENTTRPSSST
jgi:hypothetical protein